MHRRRHTLPLIACIALVVPAFGAETSYDGTYTGERVLTKGDPAVCIAKDPVSVVVHGEMLTFSNSKAKDYTITFAPRTDGSFGQLSANISGLVVHLEGQFGAGVLDSDVSSAACKHHWHLEKQH